MPLRSKMKAIIPSPEPGRYTENVTRPVPKALHKELLVKVDAFGVNRADILQAKGKYPLPSDITDVLGLEVSGTIVQVGPLVSNFEVGQQICAIVDGGAYAEYCLVYESMAMRFPKRRISELASIPESFLTAYQAIYHMAELKEFEVILIHAGAGSVGSVAIQMAKNLGATVIACCSTEKTELCTSLGADYVIDYTQETFEDKVMEYTNERGADVILDFVGASIFTENLRAIRKDGRWILLGLLGGNILTETDITNLLFKRVSIKSTTLRTQSLTYKINLIKEMIRDLGTLIEQGTMKPVIDSVASYKTIEDVFQKIINNETKGKVVCTWT